jgi:hypothetical protein
MCKRKPSLRLGLPVLIFGIAMITVASVNVGQSLQNGRPPPCFPQTCPDLAYFAILGLAGFFVAMWGLIETIAGLLIRQGHLEYTSGPLTPALPGSGPEDESIISIAKELQNRIKRPKFGTITSLAWSDYQPWYWPGFKRTGIRMPITLLLSADLRTRLDTEDWRILLAYYFQNLKPRSRLFLEFIGPYIIAIMLIPLGGILIVTEYGLQASRFYAQFVGAPLLLILLVPLFLRAKTFMLRQDRLTAELVSRQALLDVFKKIDQLQLPRIENAKRRHGWTLRLWPMPNMTERIQNLAVE